jgi:hypothetical protein
VSFSLFSKYIRDFGREYNMPWVRNWIIKCISTLDINKLNNSSAFYLIYCLFEDNRINILLQIMFKLFYISKYNSFYYIIYSIILIEFSDTFMFDYIICLHRMSTKWFALLYCWNYYLYCRAIYFILFIDYILFFHYELEHYYTKVCIC